MEQLLGHIHDGEADLTGPIAVMWRNEGNPWTGSFQLGAWIDPFVLLRPRLTLRLGDGREAEISVQWVDPNTRCAEFIGFGAPPVGKT